MTQADDFDTVELFAARNPLSPHMVRDTVPGDLTIAELIARAVDFGAFGPIGNEAEIEAVKDELRDLRVYLDGAALPFATPEEQAETLSIIAPPGSVVNLQVEPLGGSNGTARNLLNIFYQIGAVVVTAMAGPIWGAIYSAAGAAISQALFPIKKPDSIGSPNDRGALNSQSNTIRRRGMMPLQLGADRIAPDVAANAYSSNRGGDVWLTVIFAWHYGPCSVDDIKIGETLLADYPAGDVMVEHFLTPGPRDFTLYAQIPRQENLSDQLEIGGAFEVHTTTPDCDRLEIDYGFLSGLYFRKNSGTIVQQEIRFQVDWAPVGSDTWTAVPLEGGPFPSRTSGNLPTGTIEIAAQSQDPVRGTLAWTKPNNDQVKVRMKAWDPDGDDPTQATQTVYWTALRSVAFGKPVLDEYLACTAMTIKSSDDLGGSLPTITGVVTPHAPVWTGSIWLDDIEDWAPTSNTAALTRMMLIGPGSPTPYTADQFDPSNEDAYELIEANDWVGAYRLDREVTQDDALKAMAAIGRFSAYDVGEGLCFVTDWEKPVARQVFNGRNVQGYSLTRLFPKACHGVLVEFPNIDEDSKGDELFVPNDGFTEETATEILRYTIEWSCTSARAYKEGRAWLARYELGVETHQWTSGPDAIASSYGARVLVSHPSNLFGPSSGRVQMRHMDGALVAGVRLDDAVEMVADQDYALDVRRVDRVISGLAVVTAEGRTRDLMFPFALTADNAPQAGDLVSFGRTDLVSEDLEIADFDPTERGVKITARRYLGAELQQAETGEIPELQTRLSETPKAPKPRLIGIVQAKPEGVKVAFDIDPLRGALVEAITVRWRRNTDPVNPWNTLTPLPGSARVATTPPVVDAANPTDDEEGRFLVDVEIRSKLRNGDLSDPLVVEAIQIGREVPTPEVVAVTGEKRTNADGSAYPVIAVEVVAITAGLVHDLIVERKAHGAADSTYVSAGRPLMASNPKGDFGAVMSGAYDVRLAWRTSDGWLSSTRAVVENVVVPAGSLVANPTPTTDAAIAAAQAAADAAHAEAAGAASDLAAEVLRAIGAEGTLTTNLASLSSTVGTNKASADASFLVLTTATSALSASLTSLSSTVGANKASADASLATLTTDTAALAGRSTALEAATRPGAPNLVINGDFSDGLRGWTVSGTAGVWSMIRDPSLGTYVFNHATGALSDELYQDLEVTVGQAYSLSLEGDDGPTAFAAQVLFLNAAKNTILDATTILRPDNWVRAATAPKVAPAGSAWQRVHLVRNPAGGVFAATRIQVQAGAATAWRNEASAGATVARLTVEEITRTSETTALSASLTSLSATVAGNTASISAEAVTRASETGALSSSLTSLSATVGGHTSTITAQGIAIADLAGNVTAFYGFKLDVDGKVVGMRAVDDGPGGSPDTITFGADAVIFDGDVEFRGNVKSEAFADGSVLKSRRLSYTPGGDLSPTTSSHNTSASDTDLVEITQSNFNGTELGIRVEVNLVSVVSGSGNGGFGLYYDGTLVKAWPFNMPVGGSWYSLSYKHKPTAGAHSYTFSILNHASTQILAVGERTMELLEYVAGYAVDTSGGSHA